MKEELDTLIEMGLEPKEVNPLISKQAAKCMFKRLDEEAGL